jgi:hypothetical protein
MYRIEYYRDESGRFPAEVATEATLRAANRTAAAQLGASSLRGAATWNRYQGGTVYQFGPRVENNGHPFVVIVDEEAERQEAEEDDLARW